MQKLLTGLLTLLLTISLVACSNNNDKEDLSVKDNNTNTKETLSLDDEKYYFEIGSSANLEKDIKLNDGETLKIEGDYDLNKAGSYNVKVIVIDREGKERTFDKEIIVDNKDKLETLKVDNNSESKEDEDIKNEASNPSISTNQPSDKELPKDGEVTIVDNEPEITPSIEDDRDLANDKEVSNAENNNTSDNDFNKSNNYGLDTSEPLIARAFELAGTNQGGCELSAQHLANEFGYDYQLLVGGYYDSSNGPQVDASEARLGDVIRYYDSKGNYRHTSLYLGNGACYHGNYTSDHKAAVASCTIGGYTEMRYERPEPKGESLVWGTEDSCKSCNLNGTGGNKTSDDEWQAEKDAVDPSVCDVKFGWELSTAEFAVCDKLGKVNWGD